MNLHINQEDVSGMNPAAMNQSAMKSDRETILKADHLFCGYGKKGGNCVLKDIGFEVFKGEIISIIGPNGSGKTTLLKTICGILKPEKGEIFLKGREIKKISRQILARTIARVSQTIDMPRMSVGDYILMGRLPYFKRYQFFETSNDLGLVEETLNFLNIGLLKNKYMDEISGGERQLASVARALVQEPELLLLDEPTSHLDITHQAIILDQIKSLNKKLGLTVIMVIHDLNLAGEYSDRLILLNGKQGKIHQSGPPEKVITQECIKTVYGTRVIVRKHPESGRPFILLSSKKHHF